MSTQRRTARGGRGATKAKARAKTRSSSGAIDDVSIDALAMGGDGVAHVEHGGERRAVFVRGGIPKDRARVEIDFSSRPARGRILEMLAESPDRIIAPCTYFDACGACDWMTMTRDARERAHVDQIREVLPEDAHTIEMPFHRAPKELGYRARARLHVRASRGARAVVGMHERETHRPVDVATCIVLHPDLDRARALLPDLFEGAHGVGEAQIALGLPGATAYEARPVVLDVRFSDALPASFYQRLEALLARGALAGASARAGEARVPAVVGDPTPWLRGADGAPLRLPPGGFAQASEEGNIALARRVDELARVALLSRKKAPHEARVLELYAGAGNFTVLLAQRSSRLVAVEGDAAACRAASLNLTARGLSARVSTADAGAFAVPRGLDLVVLDPPRTGARDAVKHIADATAARVLYVSCDPPTLGRDLAALSAAGYLVRAVELFEMFPQTSHVETVVLLEHARRGAKGEA